MPGSWDKRGQPTNFPAEGGLEITPNDAADLAEYTRGLYVGTAGDVTVDMLNGQTVTISNLAAGVVHPLRVRRVYATGTTALEIIGFY